MINKLEFKLFTMKRVKKFFYGFLIVYIGGFYGDCVWRLLVSNTIVDKTMLYDFQLIVPALIVGLILFYKKDKTDRTNQDK